MNPASIGIAGCGLFGESHLQAYRAIPQARIDAVFDLDTGRAEQMARDFNIPRVCGSLEELCQDPNLQAIDVITPEKSHADAVLAALAAGKHVFVEKPLATDLNDCRRMVDAAAKVPDQIFMVGHILRFETKYAMLKEELESGQLGEIVSLHSRRNRPKAHLPLYGRVHPVLETGIHDIDMMLWYVGKPVERVRGFARKATGSQFPDTFWGVLEFEGGAIGIVETIWLLPEAGIGLDDAFRVMGTGGVADLRIVPGPLTFWRDSGFHTPDVSYDPRVMGSARGALRDELAYFCDCVRTGQKNEVNSGIEAMRAVRVAQALIQSADTNQDVEITEWN